MTVLTSPHDLAGIIRDRWGVARGDGVSGSAESTDTAAGLAANWLGPEAPPRAALEDLLAICFQASLLREEQRPVTFRLILAEPGRFPGEQGPPDGLHCLQFEQTRPFNPLEVRRLSPAADFYRSLLGVSWSEQAGLRIWGIIHSGVRWLQDFQGGRGRAQTLPRALVLSVTAPGRLTVGFGSQIIARLEGGQITGPSVNVFESRWLSGSFAEVRSEVLALHEAERARATAPWARLDPGVIRPIAQHLIRRLISALHSAEHGATIVMLPTELTAECCETHGLIDVKYKFQPGEPRRRFRTLILRIMRRLAETGGAVDPDATVGWQEYMLSSDDGLVALDEAMREMSQLIAGCAEVDGAVVLTKRLELLGFGGEISGALEPVPTVRQALDLEGERFGEESTESVGTRHRSTYRLCRAVPTAVAIVVSQDGGVRFVRGSVEHGAVTYWDQSSTTSLDV